MNTTQPTMRNEIVTLLSTSKPLKGLQIARKLGVHNVQYRFVDAALGKLELDGLIDTTPSGAYFLTPRAVEAGKRYGFADLKPLDNYTF